jgi:hypothetical protein
MGWVGIKLSSQLGFQGKRPFFIGPNALKSREIRSGAEPPTVAQVFLIVLPEVILEIYGKTLDE